MAKFTEPHTVSVQPNTKDDFLRYVRRERLSVSVHLVDGRQFDACIKNFDRFVIAVEVDGADHLVFENTITTIATQHSVATYFSSQHP